MRQKIQDLMTLIKRDRKTQVVVAVIGLMLLFLILGESNKVIPLPKRLMDKPGAGAMPQDEAYNDLVIRFKDDVETLKQQSHDTAVAMEQQRQEMKTFEDRTSEIFKRILERIAETEAALVNANVGSNASPVDVDEASMRGDNGEQIENDELETYGFEEPQTVPPPPPAPKKLAIVGAGDSVRIKLLAGVNAPTDGTPYPVVFKLVGDVNGPDGSALPLGEARLIAAAQGSLTDARALFRLSSLNLRLPDGRRKVLQVDGWVVGEDGKRGMEGVLIDPIGKVILGAGMVGLLDGYGRAFADSQVTTYYGINGGSEMVTGSDSKYALGRALSESAWEWGSIINQRAAMMVPHVEVLSGRQGPAVFSKSFVVKDLYESLSGDEEQFAALD